MYTGFVQRGLPRSSPKNAAAPLYKKRGEQMATWIRHHVLSASVADHLKVLIDQACHDLEFDRQGPVALSNAKLVVLEALA